MIWDYIKFCLSLARNIKKLSQVLFSKDKWLDLTIPSLQSCQQIMRIKTSSQIDFTLSSGIWTYFSELARLHTLTLTDNRWMKIWTVLYCNLLWLIWLHRNFSANSITINRFFWDRSGYVKQMSIFRELILHIHILMLLDIFTLDRN